jgi:amino acid transporter
MNSRRFICVLLGLWLGASLFMAFVAVMNFRVVNEVLANPQPELAAYLKILGPDRLRLLFRHEAAEVNRALFDYWGYGQVGFGLVTFGLLLFATKEGKGVLATGLVLLILTCILQFAITPGIIGYGRALDFLAKDQELVLRKRVASLHSAYSAVEGVKILGLLILMGIFVRERPLRKTRDAEASELFAGRA